MTVAKLHNRPSSSPAFARYLRHRDLHATYYPLWYLWFLGCGLFKYKIIRIILRLNIIFSILKYFVQIYYFKNNLMYFVRYGLLFFGEPLAIAAGIAILWKQPDVEANFASFPLWTLDSCGEKYKHDIQKHVKKYLTTVYTALILIAVASCIVFAPTPNDKNYLFPVLLIETYWPEQAWFLSLAYKLTLVPLGYSAMVYPVVVMYGAQNTMYQSGMLAEYFRGILTGSENMDEDSLFCDKEFQDEVYSRISLCVKRQIELIEHGLRTIKLIQEIFGVIIVFGYFVGVSIVMFYCSCKLGYIEYTLGNMLFPVNLCLNASTMFIGLVICGQKLEESMAKLTDAVKEWKWWALDLRNQKMMLRILVGTKDFKMRFSQTVVLNYDLGVNMVKTIYSLTSLLATFEKFQS